MIAGAAAGVAGTVVMSAFMAAAHRAGALGEPPPKKLVRRTINRLGFGTPSPVPLGVATVLAHLGFGASMGALFGALPSSSSIPVLRSVASSPVSRGALFGFAVWATSYAGWIPKLGLMPPPQSGSSRASDVDGARAPDLRRRDGPRVQSPSDGGRTILRRP